MPWWLRPSPAAMQAQKESPSPSPRRAAAASAGRRAAAGASTATPVDVKSWDAEKLSEVVSADEKFGAYAQTVREQKIDGSAALDLDELFLH